MGAGNRLGSQALAAAGRGKGTHDSEAGASSDILEQPCAQLLELLLLRADLPALLLALLHHLTEEVVENVQQPEDAADGRPEALADPGL